MPKAARRSCPCRLPVWTISRPFSSVLVAMILSRAALCLAHLLGVARVDRVVGCGFAHAAALLTALAGPMPIDSAARSRAVAARPPQAAIDRLAEARSAISRSAAGLASAMKARTALVVEIGVEQRVEMVIARPHRSWRRRRTGSRPSRRSRRRPCSRGASRRRSISGWRRGRAPRGRSPRSSVRTTGVSGREWSLWIDAAPRPRRCSTRGGEAALELVIVVAVEQVVLAIVLVLRDELDDLRAAASSAPRAALALAAAAIGVAAPGQIGVGEIGRGLASRLRRSAPAGRRRRRRASSRTRGTRPARRAASAERRARRSARGLARTRAAIGFASSGSSSAATARTALSNRSICVGKASRKKPETRKRHVDARPVEHRPAA